MLWERDSVENISTLVADLVEVQSQLAFQEDTITALNEVLTGQQQEIVVLRRQVELLKLRQEEQSASADPSTPLVLEQKPPHY